MKPALQLKLKQQLRLTPQLKQAIKLLQLSASELQQELLDVLEDNPLLEIQEENIAEAVEKIHSQNQPENINNTPENIERESLNLNEVSTLRWEEQYNTPISDANWSEDFQQNNATPETLQEHLHWQLNLSPMTERDKFIGEFIIDALKPNGRLSEEPQQLFASIPQDAEDPIEFDEFEVVRHFIQHLSPVGCASYNLQECLLSQLVPEQENYQTCKRIINDHFELLSLNDTKKFSRLTHISEQTLIDALADIKRLCPYPGDNFSQPNTNYIIPDVILQKHQGNWRLELNQDVTPRLALNNIYMNMLDTAKETPANTYIKDKLQHAKTFMSSLENRNSTLLKVSHAILEKQLAFFEEGAHKMRPLTLQNIADHVEMHESTISRITTHKYMRTPKGTFELKYFFSSQLGNAENASSSRAVQALIKKMVDAEDPKKPLSDSKLAKALWEEQNIKVARRTISKYREQLSIPSSSERKQLN